MKAKIFLGIFILTVIIITPLIYRQGQSKYLYDFHPVDKFIPIPCIYDNFTATAVFQRPDQIKAVWTYVRSPPEGTILTCRGWIETREQPYYVLELNQQYYLEKAEHIEPLIKALCALSRGGPQNNHPEEIAEAIACLPDNPDYMLELARKFKKPWVPRD